jgi:FAD/FMN-containing dehydrogenase
MLTSDQKLSVEEFGERATLDPVERMLYSHDVGAVPPMIRKVAGTAVCDAVVQPVSEEEVVRLVRWAAQQGLALTPRGKATSGYGGAIPVKRGVVVDFYRMRNVVSIDHDAKCVTVEPGITWEQLDRALMKKGLTLRLYPTSYLSSTVGGWLAQGGAGIGSYEFGYLLDNVTAARVVEPSGAVRTVSGDDLECVSGAEGTTGLITRITLRVKALEDLDIIAVSFPGARQLQEFMLHAVDTHLPLWTSLFVNPAMARLKNKAPLRLHNGRPAEERVEIPEAYTAILAVRSRDARSVRSALEARQADLGLKVLDEAVAHHEWENRFNIMVVKRMGPSLVPAEVVVPLHRLADFMNRVERGIGHPVVKEGIVVAKGRGGRAEAVILGFIPADERTFGYNLVFGRMRPDCISRPRQSRSSAPAASSA